MNEKITHEIQPNELLQLKAEIYPLVRKEISEKVESGDITLDWLKVEKRAKELQPSCPDKSMQWLRGKAKEIMINEIIDGEVQRRIEDRINN